MRGFLSGLIDLIWSSNAREDGMEALPAMQPLFWQLVQSSIAISLPASLSREKCESNVVGAKGQVELLQELTIASNLFS